MNAASDAALVAAIGRYDEAALAETYDRHAGAVFGLARRVVSDPAIAEEVVQEVFLYLWRNPDRFEPERGALRSWLLAICHGRSVDVVRSEAARRRREERDARVAPAPEPDLQEQVVDEMGATEEVGDAMAGLTEDERAAIRLAYFGGHTYREVAALLGAPEGTVKSRIRSGLKRMRSALADAGVGGP